MFYNQYFVYKICLLKFSEISNTSFKRLIVQQIYQETSDCIVHVIKLLFSFFRRLQRAGEESQRKFHALQERLDSTVQRYEEEISYLRSQKARLEEQLDMERNSNYSTLGIMACMFNWSKKKNSCLHLWWHLDIDLVLWQIVAMNHLITSQIQNIVLANKSWFKVPWRTVRSKESINLSFQGYYLLLRYIFILNIWVLYILACGSRPSSEWNGPLWRWDWRIEGEWWRRSSSWSRQQFWDSPQ